MIGSLKEIVDSMENGVYNFCKNGECSGCGSCCSALLPLSDKELNNIKKYVKKKHIKPCVHGTPEMAMVDLTCPFLDNSKERDKCKIYSVRPKICRAFRCDTPPSKVKENREMFWSTREPYYMWSIFKEVE